MQLTRIRTFFRLAATVFVLATSSTALGDVYTWQGTTSSDMGDSANWVGMPALDFVSGANQVAFGPTSGDVTPQLGPGDSAGRNWVGQPASGQVVTGLLFDVGAPSYTFGDNGVVTRSLAMWTDANTAGSSNIVNMSGNTQTFNVTVRTRISTCDAQPWSIFLNIGWKEIR